MKKKEYSEDIYHIVSPIVSSLGYRFVDVSLRRASGMIEIHLVIARPGGISLDDCSLVHTTLYPKLEIEYPEIEVRLEVASPGIGRILKSADEFPAFLGMPMSILGSDSEEWIRGTLQNIENESIVLATSQGEIRFEIDSIRKAKLESMEEAKE